MTRSKRNFGKAILGTVAAATLAISGLTVANAEETPVPTLYSGLPVTDTATRAITEDSVGMQMFGWSWNSLATECPAHLGPNGIDWILVLPPTDHVIGVEWWIHYQPTSYEINSDAGTRAEFTSMVKACNDAGVQVVVDAVVNHMASASGTSFAGHDYGNDLNFYNPDGSVLYTKANFHQGLDPKDPHFCDHDISDWDGIPERFDCNFPGLPDLATEQPYVQGKIAGYLNDLLGLGVAGFRFDAAKHMPPADLAAILKLLDRKPYVVQEVPGSTEQNAEYLPTGDVWAWSFSATAANAFSEPGNIAMVSRYDAYASTGFTPSNQSLTWVTNHDTEHHGGAVTYQAGNLYQLAFIWQLGLRYGKPMLYSAYAFDADWQQAPISNKHIADAVCASDKGPVLKRSTVTKTLLVKGKKVKKKVTVTNPIVGAYKKGQFTCVQRWPAIAGMVAFHHEVGRADLTNIAGTTGVLGFARSGAGYLVMNSTTKAAAVKKLATSLPAGVYCDLITGGSNPVASAGKCVGTKVTVAADGTLSTTVPAVSAIAITMGSKL